MKDDGPWGVVIPGNFKWHGPVLVRPLTYSIEHACAVSTLKRTTIFERIRKGDLKVKRVGRRTLILASSLHAFLGEGDD